MLPEAMPTYAELAARADGRAGTSWGVFGDDDEVGTVNQLTPERVRAATALVRRGDVFPLNLGVELPDPPLFGRGAFRHTVFAEATGTDDLYDNFFPQASSQWDGLSHVQHPDLGFYNGHARDEIRSGRDGALGIQNWAERGIVGRFLLVDLARYRDAIGRPIRLAERDAITLDDLRGAIAHQGVAVTPGTILLLHFGWLDWFGALPIAEREQFASLAPSADIAEDWERMPPCPGLDASEATAAWLWDQGVAAIATDNPGVEALPFSRTRIDTWFHYRLVSMLGFALGELWDLGTLAADCAEDGVFEGLLTSAPLNVGGGTGSTANALAIK